MTWLWILVSGDTAQEFLFIVCQASGQPCLRRPEACGAFPPLLNTTLWEESPMGSR